MKRIKHQMWVALGLMALLNITGLVQLAYGTVTPIAWYKLGEADPGAVAGNTGNATTVDSVGGFTLSQSLSPSYSADTSLLSMSSLSMKFNTPVGSAPYDAYARSTPVTTAFTGVGMEAWVKPLALNPYPQWIANNGSQDGYGFVITSDGKYRVNMPNVGDFLIGTAVVGEWVHLGFTRDAGVSSAYLNGVLVNTSALTPLTPGILSMTDFPNKFEIGDNGTSNPGGHAPFSGLIDQVRVFTFATGTFTPSDFLIAAPPVPEPSTVMLLAVGSGLLWWRRARR